MRSAVCCSASPMSTPRRASSRVRKNSMPTGGGISRAATSIASTAGRPALTARPIKIRGVGKVGREEPLVAAWREPQQERGPARGRGGAEGDHENRVEPHYRIGEEDRGNRGNEPGHGGGGHPD